MADDTTKPAQAETAPKKMTVTCLKPGWTHQGKQVAVGETVEVDSDQAKRVRDSGHAK